jgi:hypothetical protein
VNECPGSSLAFDSLVTAGYYNGKAFHRMVPNFVVQGGCPRGDGYGGMPWTLRTEIGRKLFTAGIGGPCFRWKGYRELPVLHHAQRHATPGWPLQPYRAFGSPHREVVEGMDRWSWRLPQVGTGCDGERWSGISKEIQHKVET